MAKVYLITCECYREGDYPETAILGTFFTKPQAEKVRADEKEKLISELEDEFNKDEIEVEHFTEPDQICVCVNDDFVNYFLTIYELEVGKQVKITL